MFCLKVKNLKFKYNTNLKDSKNFLENINFELFPGDFLGLIGKNGSGKSTLVRIISGLLKPTYGNILINEENIFEFLKKEKNNRFKILTVFQFPEDQIFMETVYKDVAFGLHNMNIPINKIKKEIFEALKFVNLKEDFAYKSTIDLSFGEKRKVAIAGIIALKPRILILDEPTAGLDFESKEEILQNIRKYTDDTKSTVIFVSHNIEDIVKYTNKVLLLENGKEEFFGFTKDFLKFENLKKVKSMLPSYTRVILDLREKGFCSRINLERIFDINQAVDEIINLLN